MSHRFLARTYEESIEILTNYGCRVLDTSDLQSFAKQHLWRSLKIIWIVFCSHQENLYSVDNLQGFPEMFLWNWSLKEACDSVPESTDISGALEIVRDVALSQRRKEKWLSLGIPQEWQGVWRMRVSSGQEYLYHNPLLSISGEEEIILLL